MIDFAEPRITVGRDSYEIKTVECEMCFSLQPCLTNGVDSQCDDWQACRARQQENQKPAINLTPADQAALLERMEIMQADMERLKRIASAAAVYIQAYDAPLDSNWFDDQWSAHEKLSAAVKECAGNT